MTNTDEIIDIFSKKQDTLCQVNRKRKKNGLLFLTALHTRNFSSTSSLMRTLSYFKGMERRITEYCFLNSFCSLAKFFNCELWRTSGEYVNEYEAELFIFLVKSVGGCHETAEIFPCYPKVRKRIDFFATSKEKTWVIEEVVTLSPTHLVQEC